MGFIPCPRRGVFFCALEPNRPDVSLVMELFGVLGNIADGQYARFTQLDWIDNFSIIIFAYLPR